MRNKERKKKEDGETGSFLKHQKTMKTFVYVYNTALLVLGISKEDFKNLCKLSRVVFGVHCNRGFYKFPGRSLLWTTTVIHDNGPYGKKFKNWLIMVCELHAQWLFRSCGWRNWFKSEVWAIGMCGIYVTGFGKTNHLHTFIVLRNINLNKLIYSNI